MKGLIIDLELLYFSTFRKPSSTSLILTYPIPPFTTIRGMLANALGLQRDDYSLQEKYKIGISVEEFGYKNTEMARILKLKEGKGNHLRAYPSAPMFREFIVKPKYKIYIGGEEQEIDDLYNALKSPCRSLYLGQSDDLVDITISKPLDITTVKENVIHSVVDEIVPGSIVEKVPYKFTETNGKYSVEYKIVSIPTKIPVKLQSAKDIFYFNGSRIQIF